MGLQDEESSEQFIPITKRVFISRSKIKLHRSGNGSIKIREMYLQNDENMVVFSENMVLGSNQEDHEQLSSESYSLVSNRHIFVPDSSFLTKHLSILEESSFRVNNGFLYLQSVAESLTYILSQRENKRLKALMSESGATIFLNELGSTVHTYQFDKEKTEQRYHRALITAIKWIRHSGVLSSKYLNSTIHILTSEDAFEQYDSNVPAVSVNDYISNYVSNENDCLFLQNKLKDSINCIHMESQSDSLTELEHGQIPQDHLPYASSDILQDGLRKGHFFRGKLSIFKHNAREGLVKVQGDADLSHTLGPSKEILVVARPGINRAVHNDVVVVALLDRNLWRTPSGKHKLTHLNEKTDAEEGLGNVDTGETDVVPTGRVVGIVERKWRSYVATIPLEEAQGARAGIEDTVLAVPMDPRVPKIRLRTRQVAALVGKRLVVEIDSWEPESHYPNGHYVRTLGTVGDINAEVAAALVEEEIKFEAFSAKALACLPQVPHPPVEPQSQDHFSLEGAGCRPQFQDCGWRVPEEDLSLRRDIRASHSVFSVDPPGCQDIDDAMSVRRLKNGNLEFGVHIADVTAFLHQGTALDLEAKKRATTFYLPHRRYDMLPSLLSSHLCSLLGGSDRFAVSVFWEVKEDGAKRSKKRKLEILKEKTWFGRTVIHSAAALTYDQADALILGKDPNAITQDSPAAPGEAGGRVSESLFERLSQDLCLLTDFARSCRRQREQNGALDLTKAGGELKFRLDNDLQPITVAAKAEKEIHHTIAELMILANRSVAEFIHSKYPTSSLLRIHMPPTADRIGDLSECISAANLDLPLDKGAQQLGTSLLKLCQNQTCSKSEEALVKSLTTRAMTEAVYISTGSLPAESDPQQLQHFGLGIGHYTHFTSPIRRYADVLVHRQLLAALSGGHTKPLPLPSWYRQPAYQHSKISVNNSLGIQLPISQTPSVLEQHLKEEDQTRGLTNIMPVGTKQGDGRTTFSKVVEAPQHSSEQMNMDDLDGDELLDALLGDLGLSNAESTTLGRLDDANGKTAKDASEDQISMWPAPLHSSELETVCSHINQRNRSSKILQRRCQELFLSVYLMQHKDAVQGVIFDLKKNGFLVYIPKYDFKGPVYLADKDGLVQMNPCILNLPDDYGDEPTGGFVELPSCRSMPNAELSLCQNEKGHGMSLYVNTPSSHRIFSVLDPVVVIVSCKADPSKARLPKVRLHLEDVGTREIAHNTKEETLALLCSDTPTEPPIPKNTLAETDLPQQELISSQSNNVEESSASIYQILECTKPHKLTNIPLDKKSNDGRKYVNEFSSWKLLHKRWRKQVKKTSEVRKEGRLTFGGYVGSFNKLAHQVNNTASSLGSNSSNHQVELLTKSRAHGVNSEQFSLVANQLEHDSQDRMRRLMADKRRYKVVK